MARGEQVYPLATMNPCHNGAGYYYGDLYLPRRRPRLVKLGKQEPDLDNLPELFGTLTRELSETEKYRLGAVVVRRLCGRPTHVGAPRLRSGEPRNEWVGAFIFSHRGARVIEDFKLGDPDEYDFATAMNNPYQRVPGKTVVLPLPSADLGLHPVMALVEATFRPQPGAETLYATARGQERIITPNLVGLES